MPASGDFEFVRDDSVASPSVRADCWRAAMVLLLFSSTVRFVVVESLASPVSVVANVAAHLVTLELLLSVERCSLLWVCCAVFFLPCFLFVFRGSLELSAPLDDDAVVTLVEEELEVVVVDVEGVQDLWAPLAFFVKLLLLL